MIFRGKIRASYLATVGVIGLACASIGPAAFAGLNVLAFGDSGTGDKNQADVAAAMKKICKKQGCDLGIILGDNFYENGVEGVDDRQFIKKFEQPYGDPLRIPFFASLGNHDDRGDTEAQIEYTQRSPWWQMPARFYEKTVGDVQFIAIDSNDYDGVQQRFVEETLRNSTAKWKVVFGHHPIASSGWHGKTAVLADNLLPLLCDIPGSVYVSGHDHHLELFKTSCGVPLVISGASAKARFVWPIREKASLWAKDWTHGFSRLEFADNEMTVKFYDKEGDILYKKTFDTKRKGYDND